jgi:mgtE-like transporter
MYVKGYDSLEDPLKGDESVYESAKRFVKRFINYIQGNASSLKQSFAAIFLSILTDILAGLFLGGAQEMFLLLPGMVVLVPAAIGMRGNIFASLGSRLSSALHIGVIDKFTTKSQTIRNNIYSSIFVTIIFSVALGFAAKGILMLFGMESISVVELVLISFLGGIISGVILLLLTFGIAFYSYKRGWDPDNVTSPLITALGDFFTIPALLAAAYMIMHTGFHFYALAATVIIAAACFAYSILSESRQKTEELKEGSLKLIVLQSSPILLLSMLFNSFSGVFIELNIDKIALVPIVLMLIPAFLEEGGNIGNVFSSRLGTKLHLGNIDAKLRFSNVKNEIINSYILSVAIFFTVGILTYAAGVAFGIAGLSLAQVIIICMTAGLALTTIIVVMSFVISILSFRHKLDPDNTTIPIITSLADLLGVVILLGVLAAMHII